MTERKTLSEFRGIVLFLKQTDRCVALPPGFEGAGTADLYELDQWTPLTNKDKALSKLLIERNMEWVKTLDPAIMYGLERLGRMEYDKSMDWFEGNSRYHGYREWFSINVIRHRLSTPALGLEMAALAHPNGQPKE